MAMIGSLVVPDSTQPIRAVRLWRSGNSGGIRACVKGYEWSLGKVNQAQCYRASFLLAPNDVEPLPRSETHKPPVESCQCGFWAFPDLKSLEDSAKFYLGSVIVGMGSAMTYLYRARKSHPQRPKRLRHVYQVGIVELWGKIVIGKMGYRAEYARVVELVGYLDDQGYLLAPWTRPDEWNLTPLQELLGSPDERDNPGSH